MFQAAMAKGISSLINAVYTIYSISRYYNTSERITSLLVKVTNQIVKACKNFITDDGQMRVWDQPRKVLLNKIDTCIHLHNRYQEAIQKVKQRGEMRGEKPFEFSEMYVFGKFEAFCKRLNKVCSYTDHFVRPDVQLVILPILKMA
jgi:dynein heavy chain